MAANMAKILWFSKAANRNHVNSSISQLTTRFLASAPHNYTTRFLGPVSTELSNYPDRYERVMVANFNSQAATAKPTNIDNPCLDLFYNVVKPSFSTEKKAEAEATCRELKRLLPLAWSHNPLTAVKLIWNLLQHKILMDVDGESYHVGKAYREAFYTAACWLHQHHPKTLASNITPTFTLSFGCFSDTVRILHLLLEGQDPELSVLRYADYQFLHDRVLDLFVQHLKSDIENLKQSDINDGDRRTSISEAALSCNSDCELYAQAYSTTKMRESIANKFFPRAECQGDAAEADYVDMVLQRLTIEVLMPLDKAFYDPRNDPPVEEEEDRSRVVQKYLEEVKSGKTKIVADALLPHEIIRNIHHWNVGEVAELQWIAMVEDFKKQGKMNNCLAVCDIINSTLKDEVPIALGLLVSELSEEPWKGKVVSHGSCPEMHLISGKDVRYRCEFVRRLLNPINPYRDFDSLFDLILEVAVNENLKPEQMVRKVFVFSHQDYDYKIGDEYYTSNTWKTEYEAIQKKFEDKGYGDVVPHIVFWTLSEYQPTKPARPCMQPGLTILSGFSSDLLKMFLDIGGDIIPDFVMEAAISGKEYQSLTVVD